MTDSTRTILLCEDTEFLSRAIRDFLTEKGFSVIVTADGQAAWEAISSAHPDVLITDYELPILNGLDLLALINGAGLDLPVIFMTSAGTEKVAAEALNLGAASYVIKGKREATLHTLERALRKALYHLDLERTNRELVEKLKNQNDHLEKLVAARTADLERAFEELKSLDRMKSDFMTLISHEMRTPISSILGFSEILRNRLYADERELEEIHGHLFQAGTRLSSFANDAIELFEWFSGHRVLNLTRLPVAGLIQRALDEVAAPAREKQVRLVCEAASALEIEGDFPVLEQALVRVIDNAVKFSHELGEVRVRASAAPGSVTIEIVDQGIGIDPERACALFRPLEVCGDLIHHQEGQGLGLPLVREAVEAHGGEVTVCSEGLGKGTTVRLELCDPAAPGTRPGRGHHPFVDPERLAVATL